MTRMGRKPTPPEDRRTRQAVTYLTPAEEEVLLAMSATGGSAEVLRHALALYVACKYPELTGKLREDIRTESLT